ncbi:MAG TPA: hypothetical protein VGJ94_00670 [Syntrophorhabdaceae bacterium]|jgi:hypothetical protein
MRRSTPFLGTLAAGFLLVALLFVHGAYRARSDAAFIKEREVLVKDYGLTDLCLFTDARYTRNPSVADRATPFQDHPLSLEHFPSGSIIAPPPGIAYGLD